MDEICNYLWEYHQEEIKNCQTGEILEDEIRNYSVLIDLKKVEKESRNLLNKIIENPHEQVQVWSDIFYKLQLETFEKKSSFSHHSKGNLNLERYVVRFHNYSNFIDFPEFVNVSEGQFYQFKAKVLRSHIPKLIEVKRLLHCKKCKSEIPIEASYKYNYIFESVRNCPSSFCKGTPVQNNADEVNLENCVDYQEIIVQPSGKEFGSRRVTLLTITLEDDLVDICAPGDSVIICGTAQTRWTPNRGSINFTIRAISIIKEQVKPRLKCSIEEYSLALIGEWTELLGSQTELKIRDRIVQSIAPMLKGMFPIKLAIALILCSITNKNDSSSSNFTRENSHLMLVGDPGLGKSQLLKAASEIALRSVSTTGMGSTKAGLTAAALKEDGEWQLEAGALVLADGGICCIDEFNLMRKIDKASIHEALEQQTVSVAKAGIVCKLNSRCSVIAGMNQKNIQNSTNTYVSNEDTIGLTFGEIGLSGPLLSRFDLVFVLEDQNDVEWSMDVAEHVFKESSYKPDNQADLWDLDKLRSHFIVSQNIDVKVTEEAHQILAAYYHFYRNNIYRDPSRTTVRMLDSLLRLTKAHAKLLLRYEANILDAVIIIRLMEASFGFGKLVASMNIIKEKLPMGPSREQIVEVLDNLKLPDLAKKYQDSDAISLRSTQKSQSSSTSVSQEKRPETSQNSQLNSSKGNFCDLDNMFNDDSDEEENGSRKIDNHTSKVAPKPPQPTTTSDPPKSKKNWKQQPKNSIRNLPKPSENHHENPEDDSFWDTILDKDEILTSTPAVPPRKTSTNLLDTSKQNLPAFSQVSSIHPISKVAKAPTNLEENSKNSRETREFPGKTNNLLNDPLIAGIVKPIKNPTNSKSSVEIFKAPETNPSTSGSTLSRNQLTKAPSSKYENFSKPNTFSEIRSQIPPETSKKTNKTKTTAKAFSKFTFQSKKMDKPKNPETPIGENVWKNLEGLAEFFGGGGNEVGSSSSKNDNSSVDKAKSDSISPMTPFIEDKPEEFNKNLADCSSSLGKMMGNQQSVNEDLENLVSGNFNVIQSQKSVQNLPGPSGIQAEVPEKSTKNIKETRQRLTRFQYVERNEDQTANANESVQSIPEKSKDPISLDEPPAKVPKTNETSTPGGKNTLFAKLNADFDINDLDWGF